MFNSLSGYNVILQERDYKIFSFLAQNEFATAKQIKRAFFNDCSDGNCRSRLSKLLRANMIQSMRYCRDFNIYMLKSKGLELVRQRQPDTIFINVTKYFNLDKIEHKLGLSEIRSFFELNHQFTNWQSDRTLDYLYKIENIKRYVPDALIYQNNRVLILEYERTGKSTERIKDKMSKLKHLISEYYRSNISSEVLFLTEGKGIKNRYIKAGSNSLIHIHTMNEFRSGDVKI